MFDMKIMKLKTYYLEKSSYNKSIYSFLQDFVWAKTSITSEKSIDVNMSPLIDSTASEFKRSSPMFVRRYVFTLLSHEKALSAEQLKTAVLTNILRAISKFG